MSAFGCTSKENGRLAHAQKRILSLWIHIEQTWKNTEISSGTKVQRHVFVELFIRFMRLYFLVITDSSENPCKIMFN